MIQDIYAEPGLRIVSDGVEAILPVDEFMFALESVATDDSEAVAKLIEQLAKPPGLSLGKSAVIRAGRAYHIVGRLQAELSDRLKKNLNGSLTPSSATSTAPV